MSELRLEPGRPLLNLRRLRDEAVMIARLLRQEVGAARARGYSWNEIADALAVHGHHGRRDALGPLFPGGASPTTLRRMFQ